MMQQTNFDMINNRIKTAKFKLNQHRDLGQKSNLSIHQVARLMDTLRKGEDMTESNQPSYFFSMN